MLAVEVMHLVMSRYMKFSSWIITGLDYLLDPHCPQKLLNDHFIHWNIQVLFYIGFPLFYSLFPTNTLFLSMQAVCNK